MRPRAKKKIGTAIGCDVPAGSVNGQLYVSTWGIRMDARSLVVTRNDCWDTLDKFAPKLFHLPGGATAPEIASLRKVTVVRVSLGWKYKSTSMPLPGHFHFHRYSFSLTKEGDP